jgi:hypothetical protein
VPHLRAEGAAAGSEHGATLLVALAFAEFYTVPLPSLWNIVFTPFAERVQRMNVPHAEYHPIQDEYDRFSPTPHGPASFWLNPQRVDLLENPNGGTVTLLDGRQAQRAERSIRRLRGLPAARQMTVFEDELGGMFPWIREQPERGHLFLTFAEADDDGRRAVAHKDQ